LHYGDERLVHFLMVVLSEQLEQAPVQHTDPSGAYGEGSLEECLEPLKAPAVHGVKVGSLGQFVEVGGEVSGDLGLLDGSLCSPHGNMIAKTCSLSWQS
jgi:hypothetical protein